MNAITPSQLIRLFYQPLGIPSRRWLDTDCLDNLTALHRREPDNPALLELRVALNTAIQKWGADQYGDFVHRFICARPDAARKEKAFLILLSIFNHVFIYR